MNSLYKIDYILKTLEDEILACKLAHNLKVLLLDHENVHFVFDNWHGIFIRIEDVNFLLVADNLIPEQVLKTFVQQGGYPLDEMNGYRLVKDDIDKVIEVMRQCLQA